MAGYQLPLDFYQSSHGSQAVGMRHSLAALLEGDLDFHGQNSGYASHNFHSFPAKFPPQLPRKFIKDLTAPGDLVLDPMVGSGTTVVEACLTGRQPVGFDIDPLAVMLSRVKTTPLDLEVVAAAGERVLRAAKTATRNRAAQLEGALDQRWNATTRQFVDYWFTRETQLQLQALISEIVRVQDASVREFLQLVFSSIIITKTGGVSLAFDLAHTRPHRAKVVKDMAGCVILGKELVDDPGPRTRFLTKTVRSAFDEFGKRLKRNLIGLGALPLNGPDSLIQPGDARNLPLKAECIDLIVTSPPYASNAIDYMRAHKFSLVWLGYPIAELGQRRKEYIGGEAVREIDFVELPDVPASVVAELAKQDEKKSRVLHRYYSEMTHTLREMHRVLKPGRSAIVVVGNSIMRGVDTRTDISLAEIGRAIGFAEPRIVVRELDRNRRMMPAGMKVELDSQIQQRMHQEYVIGLTKPKS